VAAEAGPAKTVAVVGDGAVGLLAVLAARRLGAERIIAMSRHAPRQRLAVEYGATDIVGERGDDGVARIKELTGGLGAHSVIEGVGTRESMLQAIGATRPGGHVGFVGVAHGVGLPVEGLFWSLVHLHGGPAPVRRFLPQLIELIWTRQIDPGKVFDLSLPLEQAAEGYQAMDERRAIKTLLHPAVALDAAEPGGGDRSAEATVQRTWRPRSLHTAEATGSEPVRRRHDLFALGSRDAGMRLRLSQKRRWSLGVRATPPPVPVRVSENRESVEGGR
jgi:Zinc-binding dehydrogenase